MKTIYKILITILIVVLIDFFVLFFIDNRNSNKETSNLNNLNEIAIENENTNEKEESQENKVENEVQEENIESTQTDKDEETEETNELQEAETETKNEEKAIDLAKKKWGEDSSVYFSNEGKENGKYLVSVRSKQTTAALVYYKIDLTNEEIESDI